MQGCSILQGISCPCDFSPWSLDQFIVCHFNFTEGIQSWSHFKWRIELTLPYLTYQVPGTYLHLNQMKHTLPYLTYQVPGTYLHLNQMKHTLPYLTYQVPGTYLHLNQMKHTLPYLTYQVPGTYLHLNQMKHTLPYLVHRLFAPSKAKSEALIELTSISSHHFLVRRFASNSYLWKTFRPHPINRKDVSPPFS